MFINLIQSKMLVDVSPRAEAQNHISPYIHFEHLRIEVNDEPEMQQFQHLINHKAMKLSWH